MQNLQVSVQGKGFFTAHLGMRKSGTLGDRIPVRFTATQQQCKALNQSSKTSGLPQLKTKGKQHFIYVKHNTFLHAQQQ